MTHYPVSDDGAQAPVRDWISSEELVKLLADMEGRPWPQFGKLQKPITPNDLASKRLLGHYKIGPQQKRIAGDPNGKRERGYARGQFEEVWALYLSPTFSRDTVTARAKMEEGGDFATATRLMTVESEPVTAGGLFDLGGGSDRAGDSLSHHPSQPREWGFGQ